MGSIKAAPHNGARRFGERFWHKRKYEKCGNTECISHFSYGTIGAKDPPNPAVPIVQCCLNIPKINIDEIIKAVERYNRGETSQKAEAKKQGVSLQTFQDWITMR